MKYIIAWIYSKISLLHMFIEYDKKDIEYLYYYGMIGTDEGKILRKIFRK